MKENLISGETKRINLLSPFNFIFISIFMLNVCLNTFICAQTIIFEPSDWKFECQREELTPLNYINKKIKFRNNYTLTLAGGNKEYANGSWVNTINISPEKYYRFRVYFKAEKVEQPWRSVLARVIWMKENGEEIGVAEYPRTLLQKSPENWSIIEQIYKTPQDARKAKLELAYRWDGNGKVHFGECLFEEVNEIPSRIVKIATIFHYPRGTKSSAENIEQFGKLIAKAGEDKADIVCLPEAATMAGTGLKYVSAAEPVPGPSTRQLGEIARKNNLYIVAGILERDGSVVYNTAVLIDRNGSLAGKYRKVCLPREEIDGGVTPGNDFPVFDTDFGRIGMMICWDVTFPEVARALALKGAEMILMPIWGGNINLARARAIENQIYLISSGYNFKSAVFDYTGEIVAEADETNKVVSTEVNLNEQILWPWLGDLKNRIPRELPSGVNIEK